MEHAIKGQDTLGGCCYDPSLPSSLLLIPIPEYLLQDHHGALVLRFLILRDESFATATGGAAMLGGGGGGIGIGR